MSDRGTASEVNLKLVSFVQEGENSVSGEEMIKRAKENDALLSLRHAKVLLRSQDKIPEEWRKYVLVFPGTVRRFLFPLPLGPRDVSCLRWLGARWCLRFDWFGGVFNSHYRLVCPRK